MTPTNNQIREVIGGDMPDKTIERLRAVCGLSSTPCSQIPEWRLREWVRQVRQKFNLRGKRENQSFWDGYEAAIEDVEKFLTKETENNAYTTPVR